MTDTPSQVPRALDRPLDDIEEMDAPPEDADTLDLTERDDRFAQE